MSGAWGRRILAFWGTVAVVSVVAGVVIIGSPVESRMGERDQLRIADLQGIMNATDSFWARNDRLPESLQELADDPRSAVRIQDPASVGAYEYRVLDDVSYELCATFDRESPALPGRPTAEFWRHTAGRNCFALDVDPTVRR